MIKLLVYTLQSWITGVSVLVGTEWTHCY